MKVINKHFKFFVKMILCISLFLIFSQKGEADGYNYATFKWEDFKEQYQDYWSSTCENDEDSDKCTEQVLKSQKKFFNKLYKMLTKYEKSGLYIKDEIIVSTLYYGLNPDAFRDDNRFYKNWFSKISFDFDNEDDNIDVDDKSDATSLTKESNSIKLLIKAMVGYEATCYTTSSPSYETKDGTSTPYCNQGSLTKNDDGSFTCNVVISTNMVNLGEQLLVNSGLTNFFGITRSKKHQECLDQGGIYTVANKKTVSEESYWQFLEDSQYFDNKPHFQDRFDHIIEKTGYETIIDLENAMEHDENLYNEYHEKIVEERKEIVLEIKECLDLFYKEHPETVSYFSSINNMYYYPIGSAEVTNENDKSFAKGDPVSSYILKDYNPGSNEGIDIGSFEDNVNIIAIKSGIISKIVNTCSTGDRTCNSGYGNMVVISHSDGTSSIYSYLESVSAIEGQSVSQGEIIGIMGNTGDTSEKALHFELKVSSGARVNPNTYISMQNPRPKTNSVGTVLGGNNQQTICLTLKESGASDNGIAGIMTNIAAESGFNPINLQNEYESKLGYTDESYTTAVDNGSYNNFINDSAGYGICQWTFKTRKQGLLGMAKSNSVSIGDMGNQVSFLFQELQTGYSGLYNSIMSGNESASDIGATFCHSFENPKNHTQCDTTRANNANAYYTYVASGCK
mgnify:FL=1